MQRQKLKKRKSKKNINISDQAIEYKHYQPDNSLTKYFAKLIEKQPKIK